MIARWKKDAGACCGSSPIIRVGLCICLTFVFACGTKTKTYNIETEEGRRALLDQVHLELNSENCAEAIELIEPLYNSAHTNDEIRLVRAGAHGCQASINFFDLVESLSEEDIVGPAFWLTMTKLFPSVGQSDQRTESGLYATDALHSILKSGAVVATDNEVNFDTYNPGSTLASQRTTDGNIYLTLVSMSVIGTMQNRFGNPNLVTYEKQTDLPWSTYADMDEDGCAYAGAIENMIDGIEETSDNVSGSLKTTLASIADTFGNAMDTACGFGCAGLDADGVAGADGDCTFAASECNPCPLKLRQRTNCASDLKTACAAAGVVRFINDSSQGWAGP